jgi:hypothetical protein
MEPDEAAGETRVRLASEIGEVEGAMTLVASGTASRVTLSGLRFGEQVMARFSREAVTLGIRLDPIIWPEDSGCDLVVRRIDD